eukprot:COSAG01_NODE_11014_length_2026_cov_14.677218_1_plen_54_part_00
MREGALEPLEPLIALLREEGSAGARGAAAALKNLTVDAGNREEAAKLGYVRPP